MTSQTQRTDDAYEVPAAGSAAIRTMALALWVVVGSLLAYGIAQTVIKASALFG
ncbi:hypothetical protein Cfla_2807 [Cellulomonas flavigena DSM 20109]|uniref:Uncharacterized protein n=1 Tax=Cellulomonas flavigena (strain ATCC 482 / DSM 20109 / BCRC 11376 / JCM 18109 / NBRC 3775 / NCIMB 8073 / NRS 134) TaxID=446466 RepID=D5UJQ4_CELFN|nr:hypothetical protein [Cellulomonas flavigena]ADG75692.1 hypothetical protein Cfla_2807 [Cellulomonas flavigena DSM 20109]